jgi:hypothetical protein
MMCCLRAAGAGQPKTMRAPSSTVSKFLVDSKVIDQPLTWAQVKGTFERTAPLVKDAYQQMGSKPPEAEFMRTDAGDLRGLPAWEISQWTERS